RATTHRHSSYLYSSSLSSYRDSRDLHPFPTRRSSDLFRQESFPAVQVHVGGAMALRKPRLVCAENQGDVGEDRGLGAKRPVQKRSEEHTSELQSPDHLVCRLLLEKKKK